MAVTSISGKTRNQRAETRAQKGRGRPEAASELRRAAEFHGHLGPWLVLGLRAGIEARRRLRATPFELQCRVYCRERPPHSCFIDGIQLGSGCTMGKANITHVTSNSCRATFRRRRGASGSGPLGRVVLVLRPAVKREVAASTPAGLERLARSLYSRRFDRLFSSGGN